jgi:hypothetical protein
MPLLAWIRSCAIHAKEEEAASVVRGLEWEVLLAMSSLGNLTLDNDDDDLEEGIEVAALGVEAAVSGAGAEATWWSHDS